MNGFKSFDETKIQIWHELESRKARKLYVLRAMLNNTPGHDKTYFLMMFQNEGGLYSVLGLYGKNGAKLSFNPIGTYPDEGMAVKVFDKMYREKFKKGYNSDNAVEKDIIDLLTKSTVYEVDSDLVYIEKRLAEIG